MKHGRVVTLLALALLAIPGRAATLDVSEAGDDLIFTWDTGAAETILRGTAPDALGAWQVAVSSPLRVPNENLIRGEDAFYRLASGSNMAHRIERTFDVPDTIRPIPYPISLPERHSFATAFDLLRKWPSLVQVTWNDGPQLRQEAATRLPDGSLIGDDEAVPLHGGVYLEFSSTTTVTLVGSTNDAYPGMAAEDFLGIFDVLAVPPESRRLRAIELLCGDEGTDWFDVDTDGVPDECGTDLSGDGIPDTGLYARDSITLNRSTVSSDHVTVAWVGFDYFEGVMDMSVERGAALFIGSFSPPAPTVNVPFRPPRW